MAGNQALTRHIPGAQAFRQDRILPARSRGTAMSEPAGSEYSEASPRKSRGRPHGRSWESTELIEAMHNIADTRRWTLLLKK